MITRQKVRDFLLQKRGYIKKSPLIVAKAIWKLQPKSPNIKSHKDLNKELSVIREVQSTFRAAKSYIESREERDLLEIYNLIEKEKDRPKKRLFFDIEVSPNLVLSWRIGSRISIEHDNIVQERAIICICYKWEGDNRLYSLEWNKGDDKEMLRKFSDVINSADEVVAQNGDKFDIKWLRTRCAYHKIPIKPKFNSIDTAKMAKSHFLFNSNKLDYISKFFGMDGKVKTNFNMWKDILLKNDRKALREMVKYCKKDVVLLEKVYKILQEFCPKKKFRYI